MMRRKKSSSSYISDKYWGELADSFKNMKKNNKKVSYRYIRDLNNKYR